MTGRILIVDDDRSVTRTFERLLVLSGHEVRTAHDAEEGLREADATPPDAIIVDLRMPFINGLGFAYRLRERERHRHTPVVMITGDYSLDDSMSAELRQLGIEVRFKPIWLDELVEMVRSMIEEKRRLDAAPPQPPRPAVVTARLPA